MVKIDFNRDYYGDLGVSPSATDAEIKKQFRKLALQYHPDRNRGNEEDSNEKFQIIGAAHEILSDPTQRAKYNAGRAQYTSGFPRASGVRGNPWANAGSQFQPPPRRTNAKPSGSGVPPPHPTGTGRFSNFASAVPPTAKQGSSSASSDGLKSAYAAWQNMRNEKSNSSPHKQPPSPSKNASYAPPPPPRPSAAQPVRRPVPKTPTQKARAESSFGTARRAGFHPRSDGDEPPVSSSNYSTSNRRRMEDLYANAGDDENDLDDYKPEKPPRPRVSTQHSIPRAEAFADTTSDESSSEGEAPTKVPNAARPKIPMPRRRAAAPKRTHDQASTDASRKSPHDDEFDTGTSTAGFSTPAGATTPMYDFPLRLSSTRNILAKNALLPTTVTPHPAELQPNIEQSSRPASNGRSFSSRPPCQSGFTAGCNCGQPRDTESFSVSCAARSQVYLSTSSTSLLPFEVVQKQMLNVLINPADSKAESARSQILETASPQRVLHSLGNIRSDKTNMPHSSSFNLGDLASQLPTEPASGTFSRRSTGNIETQFSPQASESFTFSAGGAPTSGSGGDATSFFQPKSTSARGEAGSSTSANMFFSRSPSCSPTKQSTFDPATWSAKFGRETFVPQRVSPTRSNTSRSATQKHASMRSSASQRSNSSESSTMETPIGKSARGNRSGIDSPNAMDIDSPPSCGQATRTPKVPPLPPKIPQASHARNVPVEPAKKEWRSGDLGGGPAIPQDLPQRRPVDGGFRGSEDSPEFYDSLNDLRNVEPFISQPGLHSMGDLKMNLPFESKPEPTPLKAPSYGNAKVQSLDFPQVPIAPVFPMASYTGAPLGANELQGYKIKFQQYLRDWEVFNRRIVTHFERRQAELEAVRASLGAADLLGDAKLRDQLEWARQDREVRSRWSMAWEEHEIQVQQYLEVKSRAK
ncbi:J protein JJJ1 [Ceratocystis fimbriata CBS 114723]|uniref:J protein JJJ1 n=1 Tax=Ceratocystis fimbriata CBS 114723 TaxID=1035309 RepID=A0A2C5WWM0_9PEZI|nr:J protein JJJ1 [Ceratocystis fimbriata CBS 114723]